jgi:hypothetical protein
MVENARSFPDPMSQTDRTASISGTFKHSDKTLTHTDRARIWMSETAMADSSKNFQNIVDLLFPGQKKARSMIRLGIGYCEVNFLA